MATWDRLLSDEDRAVLAAGGFAARRGLGARRALLVVDAQYGFVGLDAGTLESVAVYPTSAGERAWRAVERIARLLAAARARPVPVLYSQSGAPPGEEGAFDPFAPKVASVGSAPRAQPHPAHAIVAAVGPRPGEPVIQKRCASGFFGTPLVSVLHRLGVDSLVVCGFTTSGCVRATVDMDTRYADVLTAAEAEAVLRGA